MDLKLIDVLEDREIFISESEVVAISDCVDEVKACMQEAVRSTLYNYWRIGRVLDALSGKHGNTSVKTLTDTLSKNLGPSSELSDATMYRCRQFFRCYDSEMVQQLANTAVSWSQIIKALPSSKDSDKVNECVKKLVDGTVPATSFADELRKDTGTEPKERKSGKGESAYSQPPTDRKQGVGGKLSRMQAQFEQTTDALGDILLVAEEFTKLLPEERENYQEQLELLLKTIDNAAFSLTETLSRAKKIVKFDK